MSFFLNLKIFENLKIKFFFENFENLQFWYKKWTEYPLKPLVCWKNEANPMRIAKVSQTERERER